MLCWVRHQCPCPKRTEIFQEELGHPHLSKLCQTLASLSWIMGLQDAFGWRAYNQGTTQAQNLCGRISALKGGQFHWPFFRRSISLPPQVWKEVLPMKPNCISKSVVRTDRNCTGGVTTALRKASNFLLPPRRKGSLSNICFFLFFFLVQTFTGGIRERMSMHSSCEPAVTWAIRWRYCLFQQSGQSSESHLHWHYLMSLLQFRCKSLRPGTSPDKEERRHCVWWWRKELTTFQEQTGSLHREEWRGYLPVTSLRKEFGTKGNIQWGINCVL